jgi:hypothetical protein
MLLWYKTILDIHWPKDKKGCALVSSNEKAHSSPLHIQRKCILIWLWWLANCFISWFWSVSAFFLEKGGFAAWYQVFLWILNRGPLNHLHSIIHHIAAGPSLKLASFGDVQGNPVEIEPERWPAEKSRGYSMPYPSYEPTAPSIRNALRNRALCSRQFRESACHCRQSKGRSISVDLTPTATVKYLRLPGFFSLGSDRPLCRVDSEFHFLLHFDESLV